ncbi:hypothetical protein Patl1_16007 [Pistacia atlantica]|uniref:Uncharacterized protein n=1 Tax=Pistacia atlantica TaxID=434234 RepID=A0ACC1B698_9ROSI|nr:hypothetical protein Patl1_16007 [Pistacia atlantica]
MLLKLGRISLIDLDCCSRPPLTGCGKLSYNFSDVSFAPYGDYWRGMRKVCVLELFSLKRVQSFRFIREEEVASVMDSISQSSSTASPVELSLKMYALTGSIVFRMAFGKRFQETNFDDDDHRFQELIHAAMAVAGGFTAEECFPYVGWMIDRLTGYYSKLEKVCHELDTFYQQIINDHLKPEGGRTKQEHEDIIDVMLKIERDQIQSGRQAQLTRDSIKAVIMVRKQFCMSIFTRLLTQHRFFPISSSLVWDDFKCLTLSKCRSAPNFLSSFCFFPFFIF